jgi:Fanconi anemia group M protein
MIFPAMGQARPPRPGGALHIVADHRERHSGVLAHLEAHPDVDVELAQLHVADFLLGGDVAVERKTAEDFIRSILDRRLFVQVERLLEAHARPVLLLEGDPLEVETGVRPNAIRGALARLAVMRRLPVLPSSGPEETAALLVAMARQAQEEAGEGPRAAAKPRASTLLQRQEAVAAALPGVGPVLARRLLARAGSIAALAHADVEALRAVEGIGPKRARTLREFFSTPYRLAAEEEPGDEAVEAAAAGAGEGAGEAALH